MLAPDDPEPFVVLNPAGRSPVVLTCEHAGRAVPRSLGALGLDQSEIDRHIGWDIGAMGVAERLSAALDAPLVAQPYSRLVVDCNRPLHAPSHVPETSDGTVIPGNVGLDAGQRHARHTAIHEPFHDAIAGLLDARADRPTILFAVHSFTPELRETRASRPWDIGLLNRRDSVFPQALMCALTEQNADLVLAHNQPYEIEDDGDYTIPVHAEARSLAHVLAEIRQDRIGDVDGQGFFADLLARALLRISF